MSLHIRSTTDYEQFDFFHTNREENKLHTAEIIQSIKKRNMLKFNPIIVQPRGDKFYIVDGQHRFCAARKMEIPIYFVVDKDAAVEDIITLNVHRQNWKILDYILYYAKQKDESYIFMKNLHENTKKYYSAFTGIYQVILLFLGSHGQSHSERLRTKQINISKDSRTEISNFVYDTFPRCYEINRLIRTSNKKKSAVLFFKKPYISCLVILFRNMSSNEYKDLWECVNRDYAQFHDTNSNYDAMELLSQSYNYRKRENKLDFDELAKRE